jgi:hypothetical protein
MGNSSAAVATVEEVDMDAELAALLAESDESEAEELTASAEVSAEDLEGAIESIEIDEELEAAQAADTSEPDAIAIDDDATEDEKPKRSRKNTTGMKPSEIVATRFGETADGILRQNSAEVVMSTDEFSETLKQRIASFDTMPKKVGEKAINLMSYRETGAALSVYTKIAIELLVEAGSITSDLLRLKYSEKYTKGTSSAQSSQMFHLLPAFGIAQRSGNTLTLDPSSTIAANFE